MATNVPWKTCKQPGLNTLILCDKKGRGYAWWGENRQQKPSGLTLPQYMTAHG
jgi:hypothetical protein